MAKIDRFPDYDFHEDGFVISKVSKVPRILKPIKMGAYVGLQLKRADGLSEKAYLHRLICEAFNGPCPPEMECRHLDGDKTNNAASNLKWGTRTENENDKKNHGTMPVGGKNPMAKLTDEAVVAMRRHRETTSESYAKIAKKFGVSTMTAFRAITKQSWSETK